MIAISSRGVSFYVREEGHGFPILMMHGGPGADHSTLLPLLPLARKYRLILYVRALQEVELESEHRTWYLRTDVRGVCHEVLKAAGVAVPPTARN
jgi:proline iminopeptidase